MPCSREGALSAPSMRWWCLGCKREIPDDEVVLLADAAHAESPVDIYGHEDKDAACAAMACWPVVRCERDK